MSDFTIVTTEVTPVTVLVLPGVGPQGVPGINGETTEVGTTLACSTDLALSGHRFVVLDDDKAVYADCTTLDHSHRVIGMTSGASNAGSVLVQTGGVHEEPTWSWDLELPVFLSTTGFMTQTQPNSGFVLIVGFPITSIKLFIKIHQPIFLI
jgi:hypothetical protein